MAVERQIAIDSLRDKTEGVTRLHRIDSVCARVPAGSHALGRGSSNGNGRRNGGWLLRRLAGLARFARKPAIFHRKAKGHGNIRVVVDDNRILPGWLVDHSHQFVSRPVLNLIARGQVIVEQAATGKKAAQSVPIQYKKSGSTA